MTRSWGRSTSSVARGPMIVVDASCAVDVLLGTARSERVRSAMVDHGDLVAPHLLDVEVTSVIRQHLRAGRIDETAAAQAIEELAVLPLQRFGHSPLLGRVWQLRDNLRTWDALYVALAEVLDAPLLTANTRLANASGPRCSLLVIS